MEVESSTGASAKKAIAFGSHFDPSANQDILLDHRSSVETKPILLLHVGQTKTGSTAIQNYLDAERVNLCAMGIWVPETGFARANPFLPERTAGHLQLVRLLTAGETFEIDAERARTKHSVCVLSAENLFTDRSDTELRALATYFSAYEVRLVAVLRQCAGWLASRYVEDCLSGFSNDTRSFSEFCEYCFNSGRLDYASRLHHLAAIFLPKEVVVINYDEACTRDDLVETFANACGLPLTNPTLARTIHSNVREKYLFLIEAKRRLNYAVRRLSTRASLEFEVLLRRRAKELANDGAGGHLLFDGSHPPLSREAVTAVAGSDRRLFDEFGLRPEFSRLRTAAIDSFTHRVDLALTEETVSEGLTLLARLAYRDSGDLGGGKASWLSWKGASTLVSLLRESQRSLHVGDDLSASIAAMFGRRLVAFVPGPLTRRKHVDGLLSSRLPSEIICGGQLEDLQSILAERRIELIVCGAGVTSGSVLDVVESWGHRPVIALTSHNEGDAEAISSRLGARAEKHGDSLWIVGDPNARDSRAVSIATKSTIRKRT